MYDLQVQQIEQNEIDMCSLKIGDLAKITTPDERYGSTVLRIKNAVVSLNDPHAVWDLRDAKQFRVRKLLPDTIVTLAV